MSFDDALEWLMIGGGVLLALWTILLFIYSLHLGAIRRLLRNERAAYHLWRRFEEEKKRQESKWN